jgi:ADP-ribose pyrophosphatase YjhB (NUDIX family)
MSVDQGPPRRQRIAAYAVLVRGADEDREVLLTRMSDRTRIQGVWTLPGGGIDHGEDPRDAVRREV